MTNVESAPLPSFRLGPMPMGKAMSTVDERLVRAPMSVMFAIASAVEEWPGHLAHYRWVRMRERAADGGGIVDMSAYRPFGLVQWPTWWRSQMEIRPSEPEIRFRHIAGITKGMEVAWEFQERGEHTHVRIVHSWDGPRWPLIGVPAAVMVIGPIFIHGIASRTLEGLARVAERFARQPRGQ